MALGKMKIEFELIVANIITIWLPFLSDWCIRKYFASLRVFISLLICLNRTRQLYSEYILVSLSTCPNKCRVRVTVRVTVRVAVRVTVRVTDRVTVRLE